MPILVSVVELTFKFEEHLVLLASILLYAPFLSEVCGDT